MLISARVLLLSALMTVNGLKVAALPNASATRRCRSTPACADGSERALSRALWKAAALSSVESSWAT